MTVNTTSVPMDARTIEDVREVLTSLQRRLMQKADLGHAIPVGYANEMLKHLRDLKAQEEWQTDRDSPEARCG